MLGGFFSSTAEQQPLSSQQRRKGSQNPGGEAKINFTGALAGPGNGFLSMLGVRPVNQRQPSPRTAGEYVPGVSPRGEDPYFVTLGARLPFVAFVSIVGTFTYVYHMAPIVPWLLVFLSLDFAIIVCWPSKMMGTHHRTSADWGRMYAWLIATILAVIAGLLNYGVIESWINTAFLREYSDVHPNVNPAAIVDAGVLHFAKETTLDTAAGAGYKFWFSNYCAAPVVGADPTAAPITFWAVGIGCCNSRGEFVCDSAQDSTARSAMPLRPYNIGPEITSHYQKAIQMSAAANDLEVSKETVFVVWHKDPIGVGKRTWWISTGIFFALILVALCACTTWSSGLQHMSVTQRTAP